ncbi:uncharacterized protein LOC125524792 [Triticum urartu]|uniref:uncharacterized protein LOC125524792 n=1 Tax=Triticum urartu TaxID=4572 RepID=UPI002042C086|nr:uncharacterized protein LOC125524792 [Triticum urartu]
MAPPVPSGEQRRLLDAAADGNLDLFKSIASALAGEKGRIKEAVEAVRDRGAGALHVAAVHGRMQVCAYLVEEIQIDVNAADDKGDTPLTFALRGCTVEIVKYLLHHGADPNNPDENGITALHVAAGEGMCEMIEVLLSKGADVNSFSKCGTPLYLAIIGEQVAAVKTLLDHHADYNKELAVYSAPLITALEVRSLKCVELLIKAGADVKSVNPLIVAANGGLTEFYKCLLGAGADPNDCDEGGQLPIEIAARNNRREDVEILFPVTSRIPYIPDWSIDGIIAYVKSEPKEEEHRVRSTTPGVHLLSSKKRYWDEKDQIMHEEFSRKFKVQRTVTGVTGKRARDEDLATATAVAEEFCGGPQSFKKTRLEPTLEVVRSRDLWALQDNLRLNIRHALPRQMLFIQHIKHQPCSLHFHLRDGLYPSPKELIEMMSRSDIVQIKKFALVVDMEIEEAQMWEYVTLVSARLVEELHIEFVEATISVFPLFGCNNSLKHLRLKHIHLPTYGLDIDPIGGVVFSSLAILELCAVRLADNGLTELMKLCPSAHTVRLIGMEYLKEITFPTLDKLRFIKLSRCRNATLVDVETFLGLQSFHYIGPLIEMFFHKNASLKELFVCFEGEKVTEDYSSGWLEGAPDFSRIRILTVCSYSLNVLASGIVKNMNLKSLTELQIIISALDEIVIADVYDFLMLPSSSLERLFLKLPESSLGARMEQEIQRDDDGVELKKLALMSVNGFDGSDNQMRLLENVLAKAPKLKDLMLVCPRDRDGLEMKVRQLFRKCSEATNACVKTKEDESSPRPMHSMPTSSAIDAE